MLAATSVAGQSVADTAIGLQGDSLTCSDTATPAGSRRDVASACGVAAEHDVERLADRISKDAETGLTLGG
jgi:hypothetical protein